MKISSFNPLIKKRSSAPAFSSNTFSLYVSPSYPRFEPEVSYNDVLSARVPSSEPMVSNPL